MREAGREGGREGREEGALGRGGREGGREGVREEGMEEEREGAGVAMRTKRNKHFGANLSCFLILFISSSFPLCFLFLPPPTGIEP